MRFEGGVNGGVNGVCQEPAHDGHFDRVTQPVRKDGCFVRTVRAVRVLPRLYYERTLVKKGVDRAMATLIESPHLRRWGDGR